VAAQANALPERTWAARCGGGGAKLFSKLPPSLSLYGAVMATRDLILQDSR